MVTPVYKTGTLYFLSCESLKGQCVGIEAMQLCMISQPMKSLM